MDSADFESQLKDISSHEIENVNITEGVSFTTEEERALVRKIDLTLLPTIWVMYLLSYLDRTNIGNAKISGMELDLNLTSNQYSIALVVFFVGYVVFEVPSNLALGKSRPSIFLPSIMILWGILTCVMAVVKSFTHLVVLRVILGCVEAGFAPGVILLLSSWYKQTEQSKRFGVFISAAVLSGAFGGLIAAGIVDGLEGVHGIRGWRWLFIIEGAATIGFAMISLFILPDFPATSRRLSEREKKIAVARLALDNVTATTHDSEHLSSLGACKVACQDCRTWAFVIGYMVIVGSSTLTYFYPTLVEGLFGSASTKKINLLTVPIYGVAFIATGVTSYYSDKVPNWRGLIIASWLTFALICSIIVCTVYNFTARYVLLILMASGLWATNGGTLAYASSAFAGMHPQARGVALAMVNALGNLAQIYGSYLFPEDDSPKYIMGFSVISAMLAVGVVVFLFLHIWFRRRQRSGIIQ
ncbi:vitamin H transporter [Penicillium canescens]|uniref:Vitamin H transporter n=1 Tax=Penicillium canescens TaxID=5083 RepID=A0AAD6IJR7_PENCN|nr:vitamin H transporter [Penicillium canescens]KAJ6051394.1 vitamin H transporter [Penicillium canescens]KAJ6061906.1 vitamin H transporter [Penicillium canescens]KAJ6065156.1 vitamin H transporter [Penicillium canescens]KAJ6068871.1 vitamin H transporter [Penicillium canescens]KAJ6183073.1 vitamin H transporter [Penicillium canescens]